MKILIIGHYGNLGQKLMAVFKEHKAIGWDRNKIDITQEAMVKEKISLLNPEIIINASAYNAVDKCENDDREFRLAQAINGTGPGYLAEAARESGAVLVHYSTDYVFDGKKKAGYSEEEIPNPIQKYGESKLLGEEKVKENCSRYYLIRTSKLFGFKGTSSMAKKSFIDLMLNLATQKNALEVVDEEVSCFTYTNDLAKATKDLLFEKKERKNYPFGIYHFVNENPCTWFECAKKVFEITKKAVKVVPVASSKYPRPAKRPAYSVLLNTKFPKLRSWEKAAEEYLKEKKII